jgi:hydroxypyruvate isomerase
MMITEDHQQVMEGKLPINYQNVLHEYDIYHANGGNSYISEKVEDYKTWFKEIQAKK